VTQQLADIAVARKNDDTALDGNTACGKMSFSALFHGQLCRNNAFIFLNAITSSFYLLACSSRGNSLFVSAFSKLK